MSFDDEFVLEGVFGGQQIVLLLFGRLFSLGESNELKLSVQRMIKINIHISSSFKSKCVGHPRSKAHVTQDEGGLHITITHNRERIFSGVSPSA
jgi:hypothetical protein